MRPIAFVFLFFISTTALALPPESLLQTSAPLENKWGLASVYRFREIGTSPRFNTDFALSAYYQMLNSRALIHVKRNTFALAYSYKTNFYILPKLRWSSGIDLGTGKYSLFQEAQKSLFLGQNHEFVIATRIQNTGYSVESGDGAEFEEGAITRYWHVSAETAYRYKVLSDLHVTTSVLYRYALGAPAYASSWLAHLSVQIFWGEQ